MSLPFWDDFSFRQEVDFPNDTMWLWGTSVWVNHGRAINPPSIYTATFDGIDSTGKTYNKTEVLAKGFADKLESRPIKLDAVPTAQKDSVYLSFFYQVTGLGESPDLDDNFSLWFFDSNNNWEKVFEVSNSVNLRVDSFYYVTVKVEERFHHENFKFKFQNFGRLSGPYDTWNLDYIFLNTQRSANDNYFPDRAIIKPFTSILQRYRAVPMKHYRDTATTITIPPTGSFGNLLFVRPDQPINYYTWATVISKKEGIETVKDFFLDSALLPTYFLSPGEVTDITTNKAIPIDSIDITADSVVLKLKMSFDSGDEAYLAGITEKFVPTNFFLNDTVRSDFILHKHYAYDDGTAEYGGGLNAPATEMAYSFPLFTKEIDTLKAVEIYFPEFGIATTQSLLLKIWRPGSDGKPQTELHQQTITVVRSQFNTFHQYELEPGLLVQGKFMIGWQQNSTGLIAVGIDKNNDSGDDIYFNTNGTWEQNQNVRGSLMIRPVFGNAGELSQTTGIESKLPPLYPNPARDEFYVPGKATNLSIMNMLGAELSCESEIQETRTKVRVQNLSTGLYLVRWIENGNIHTSRLLLRDY